MPPIFSQQLQHQIQQQILQFSLPDEYYKTVCQWHGSLCEYIATKKHHQKQTSIISLNGAQGAGKSTLSSFVALILKEHFNLHCVVLSLDDFYLSQKERLTLAEQIHPLFKTRGVPGTHNINLAIKTLQQLKTCNPSRPCFLPRFNKANDNPLDSSLWPKVTQPVDIILFEGWCNHVPAQTEEELKTPINDLERQEDTLGIWRRYSNEQLKIYNQRLFSLADQLIYMQIPSFDKVLEWRGLQEKKLLAHHPNSMDKQSLIRFIQHFERLTKSAFYHLPKRANVIIKLGSQHDIQQIMYSS